jgi:hypothetical protein
MRAINKGRNARYIYVFRMYGGPRRREPPLDSEVCEVCEVCEVWNSQT